MVTGINLRGGWRRDGLLVPLFWWGVCLDIPGKQPWSLFRSSSVVWDTKDSLGGLTKEVWFAGWRRSGGSSAGERLCYDIVLCYFTSCDLFAGVVKKKDLLAARATKIEAFWGLGWRRVWNIAVVAFFCLCLLSQLGPTHAWPFISFFLTI